MIIAMGSRGACARATIRYTTLICLIAATDGLSVTSGTEKSLHNEKLSVQHNDRFPFNYVFFGHVPKTGGTSMREILQVLGGLRQQSVQVCYNNVTCDAEAGENLAKSNKHITNFAKADATDQIIYGHGVQDGFAAYWGLEEIGSARVMMVRDPISLIGSLYQHFFRLGGVNVSFDEYVGGDQAKNGLLGYMHFVFSDFEDADFADHTRFIKHWEGVRSSTNMLLLRTENYKASVIRLAHFLGASPSEEQQMLQAVHKRNAAPSEYELTLSESNLARLKHMCGPLQMVYESALEQENQAGEFDTRVHFEHDIVHLMISSPTFVEDED